MDIVTRARPLQRTNFISPTGYGYGYRAPTADKPNYDGLVDLGTGGGNGEVPLNMKVWPIGIGNINDIFAVTVWSWAKYGSGLSPRTVWIPTPLVSVAATLGSSPGVSGSPVSESEVFAQVLTVISEGTKVVYNTAGNPAFSAGTVTTHSPGSGLVAHFLMPLQGFDLIEFTFSWMTGQPIMNSLFSLV